MTRRTRYRDLIIGTSNRTCQSSTPRQAPKTKTTSPSSPTSKITSTLPVSIRTSSQREFQNLSRSSWATIWSRRITTKPIHRRARTTLQATVSRTSPKTRWKKCTLRASILSRLTRRTALTPRRTDHLTPLSVSAWTRTMAFRSMIELAMSVTARVTSATSRTVRALLKTQGRSSPQISVGRNKNSSNKNHPSKALDRVFKRTTQPPARTLPKIKQMTSRLPQHPRSTSTSKPRSSKTHSSNSPRMFRRPPRLPKPRTIIRDRHRAAARVKNRKPRARIIRDDLRI